MGDAAITASLKFAQRLRQSGYRAEVDSRGLRLKGMLRRADSMQAKLVVVLGETELERSVAAVKDLAAHTQTEVPFDQLIASLISQLSAPPGRTE
jgi:histidyl-tRNA synthetase